MMQESLENIEQQVASSRTVALPTELRGRVLADVNRELRASRWDRRLARSAVVLLALGVGLNAGLGLRSNVLSDIRLAQKRQPEIRPSLVDTAIVVANATDALTAQRFAQQLAAMTGRKLTDVETAAIEAAVRRASAHNMSGNKG
jgi:hypothetical protein